MYNQSRNLTTKVSVNLPEESKVSQSVEESKHSKIVLSDLTCKEQSYDEHDVTPLCEIDVYGLPDETDWFH